MNLSQKEISNHQMGFSLKMLKPKFEFWHNDLISFFSSFSEQHASSKDQATTQQSLLKSIFFLWHKLHWTSQRQFFIKWKINSWLSFKLITIHRVSVICTNSDSITRWITISQICFWHSGISVQDTWTNTCVLKIYLLISN